MLGNKAFLLYTNYVLLYFLTKRERKMTPDHHGYAKIRRLRAITLKPSKKYTVNGINSINNNNNKINQHQ